MFARLSLFFLLFFASCLSQKTTQFPEPVFDNQRVLFLGDSITHAGGYVSFIEYELNKRHPEKEFDIISIGLSSETASGLSEKQHPFPRPCIHSRLDSALEKINPNLVFACYGMNDGIYHPQSKERFQAYKDGILKLRDKVQASGAKLILLTPPLFDAQVKASKLQKIGASDYSYKRPYENYNEVLRDYGQWILKESGLPAIDTNTPMLDMTRKLRKINPKASLTGDGIHPSDLGHLVIAQSILGTLKIIDKKELGNIKLSEVLKDPLYKLINQRRKLRSDAWLRYVGYLRGKRVLAASIEREQEQVKKLAEQIHQLKNK